MRQRRGQTNGDKGKEACAKVAASLIPIRTFGGYLKHRPARAFAQTPEYGNYWKELELPRQLPLNRILFSSRRWQLLSSKMS